MENLAKKGFSVLAMLIACFAFLIGAFDVYAQGVFWRNAEGDLFFDDSLTIESLREHDLQALRFRADEALTINVENELIIQSDAFNAHGVRIGGSEQQDESNEIALFFTGAKVEVSGGVRLKENSADSIMIGFGNSNIEIRNRQNFAVTRASGLLVSETSSDVQYVSLDGAYIKSKFIASQIKMGATGELLVTEQWLADKTYTTSRFAANNHTHHNPADVNPSFAERLNLRRDELDDAITDQGTRKYTYLNDDAPELYHPEYLRNTSGEVRVQALLVADGSDSDTVALFSYPLLTEPKKTSDVESFNSLGNSNTYWDEGNVGTFSADCPDEHYFVGFDFSGANNDIICRPLFPDPEDWVPFLLF